MKKLIFTVLICITASFLSFTPGSMTYIVNEECLCANTSSNYSKMTKISVNKDKEALMKMVKASEVFVLDRGVIVELLDGGISMSKVKVKSGKLSGKTVYVSSSFIKKQ